MALEMPVQDERQTRLAALIEQASEAHAQYENVVLKRVDPDWPRWLAGFVLDRNPGSVILANVGEDQLAQLLRRYDADYQSQGGNGPRPAYFAERLLAVTH